MDSKENTEVPPQKRQEVIQKIKSLLDDPQMPEVIKDHFKQELKEPDEPKYYQFYEGAD